MKVPIFVSGILWILIIVFCVPITESKCPSPWLEYNNTCYFFSINRYRFNDASLVCTSRNASLYIPHTQNESDWVTNHIKQGSRILYWVGLRLSNKTWTWEDGTQYDKNSTNWFRNREGNKNDARTGCAAVYSYKPDLGHIQARRCTDSWGIICTRPNDMVDLCNADDGWHLVNQHCFKLFNQTLNWFDARQTCKNNGGDLFMPEDYKESYAIGDLVQCRTAEGQSWIGVTDVYYPGRFQWANNNTLRYQYWYSYGRVILKKGGTCVYANPVANFAWDSELCTVEKRFICARPQGTCPDGWYNKDDHCYQINDISTSQMTWYAAKQFCEAQNTQLLTLDNSDEEIAIESFLGDQKVQAAWLGFSDDVSPNSYQWVNGTPVGVAYTNWDRGFPRSHGQKVTTCGIIQIAYSRSKWSSGYCYNTMPFVCKAPLQKLITIKTPPSPTNHCDPGWKYFGNSQANNCYYFGESRNSSGYSWSDAQRYCFTQNSQLVDIRNPYEQSFITENQVSVSTAWIGLKYSSVVKRLAWSVDQSAVTFQAFYPGEPDDIDNGEWCVKIVGGRQDYTGAWDDSNCTELHDFICKKPAIPGGPLATPPPSTTAYGWSYRCGPEWTYNSLDNFCYWVIVDSPKTWSDAQWDCERKGGNLASITGPREQNFLQAMLSTGRYASVQNNYWIGATDADQEGGWGWNDNSPFAYLHWDAGEPNEYGVGEDCGELLTRWEYRWNDKRCDKTNHYICKKTALPMSTSPGTPTEKSAVTCKMEAMISGNYSLLDSTTGLQSSSSRSPTTTAAASRWYTGSVGGWSAQRIRQGEFVQAIFYNLVVMKAVITVGRSDADEWVTAFKLQYRYDTFSEWVWYEQPPGTIKVFTGNTDSTTPVTNTIQFPIEAKSIKIFPTSWHNGISLRWEVLGCIENFCNPDYAVSGPLVVREVGMSAYSVSDSYHDAGSARLHPVTFRGRLSSWRPSRNGNDQWLQIDLGTSMIIRGVTTAGNPDAPEWVSSYKFSYNFQGLTQAWNYYQEPFGHVKTLQGNTNNTDMVTHFFKGHFQARFVRVNPVTWNQWIALRVDILVCANGCTSEALINGPNKLNDDRLHASSQLDNEHGAFRSRLNIPAQGIYGGAWTAKYNDHRQYIQADFGATIQVTGLATQGRQDQAEWVTEYNISYSQDGKTWFPYNSIPRVSTIFDGNWDQDSVRKHNLLMPVLASSIRLWPNAYHRRISLRWEVYGCPGADSGMRLGCYADDPQHRDLNYEPYTDPSVGMWPPMCIHHCFNKGYYYAGLQAQYQCFCGNSYGRYGPATDCSLNCFPLIGYNCGGRTSNTIYSTGLTPNFKVCPPDWKGYGDKCYVLMLDTKTWAEARRACKQLGADLATVNGQPVQDLLYSIINEKVGHNVWIGLNDQREEDIFEWVAGEPVKYTNWNVNEPSNPTSVDQDCVMMANVTGAWQDEDCNSQNQYMCMALKHGVQKPPTTPPVVGCNQGWISYRWKCYLVIDMPRSFNQAQQICYTRSAKLVRVQNKIEQSFLSSLLGSKTGQYWTDVSDTLTPGTYRNSDGSATIYFTNWGPNSPSQTGRCVAMGTGSNGGLWFDRMCNSTAKAICEQIRRGYTTPTPPSTTTSYLPCPQGWIDAGDGYCYQVNTKPRNRQLSWDDASHDCRSQGSHLASFHNSSAMDYLWRNSLIGNNLGSYWIGLTDLVAVNSHKVYHWEDNSPLDLIQWNRGEPNNDRGTEDCVELYVRNGNWNDDECANRKNWICKIRKGVTPLARTTFAVPTGLYGHCGSLTNYVYFNGNCYYVNDGAGLQHKTWREARKVCQSNGGDLTSISSINEQHFIQSQMLNLTSMYLWTGFNEIDSAIGYQWSDGSAARFVNWRKGEPNDFFGAEDCVSIGVADGLWDDNHCGYKFGYVCKTTPGKPTPSPTPSATIQGNCPSGFYGYHNKCFRLFTNPKTWDEASAYCHNTLGKTYYLASIADKYENAFVTTLLYGKHLTPWIGINTHGGKFFTWIDNSDVTYTYWDVGEPNGGWGRLCGRIYGYQYNAGKWDDVACTDRNAFICQTKRSTSILTPEPIPTPCDSRQGFVSFGHDCFLYVSNKMNWTQADKYCQSRGAYLSTISDQFEQDFLFLLIRNVTAVSSVWIGLKRKTNDTYSWSQPMWAVTFTNWKALQPSLSPSGGCVYMDTVGEWADVPCSFRLPFVCKITTASSPASPPPPNGQCEGSNWIPAPNSSKCYEFNPKTPLTYLDATLDCQRKRATLVSLHSIVDNNFIISTVKSMTTQVESVWLSLHKSSAGFTWTDGSPVQFMYWDDHEPSGRGQRQNTENCVVIRTWSGKWNDVDCSYERGYICQRDKVHDTNIATMPTMGPTTSVPISPTSAPSPSLTSSISSSSANTRTPATKTPSSHKVTTPSHSTPNVPPSIRPPTGSVVTPIPPVTRTASHTGMANRQTQQNQNTKSLGGGGIAGIVIACIVVVALAGVGIVIWRRKTNGLSSSLTGFDNSVYQYDPKKENGGFQSNGNEYT